ncbi:MAG TPA: SDR family oxidoreductase [Bryobacteraceae bacterium]|nr:SDR family oxidoreductase [Bryobacteraceae bacterium]
MSTENREQRKQNAPDPRGAGPKPPFKEDPQPPPASETKMRTKPDHGEESYRGSSRLAGMKALITGADSGIGRAVAIAFAREGADIVISYLDEDEDAAETERWVKDAGRKALLARGDIREEQVCRQQVERCLSELGSIDILVNNAAFQMTHKSIEELSSEEWDRTFKTNIYAMFYFAKAALPKMKAGGSIINTASVEAYQPSPALLAYSATKGAIVTFSKSLSGLAIKQGVRVNAVAPGPVWTPLIPSTMPQEKVENFGNNVPIGRPAQPAELAPMYVFLASKEARFITGGLFDVTGGRMLP